MRSATFLRTGGVVERLVVEVEGNVHLDLDRAGLDCGARRIHRSEKGARREGEKSNEKRTEHDLISGSRLIENKIEIFDETSKASSMVLRQDLSLRSSSIWQ